jgi:hypothetical protein
MIMEGIFQQYKYFFRNMFKRFNKVKKVII